MILHAVSAVVHSHRGLPGVEPEQPNPSKETASATDPAVPARCYSCPTTSCPPQNTHQLQRYGVTGANSYPFPISQALAHQHHHQPRRRTRATCTLISPTRMHEFLDNWCKFFHRIIGILSYCTIHRIYVQIAETEVHSRTVLGLNTN